MILALLKRAVTFFRRVPDTKVSAPETGPCYVVRQTLWQTLQIDLPYDVEEALEWGLTIEPFTNSNGPLGAKDTLFFERFLLRERLPISMVDAYLEDVRMASNLSLVQIFNLEDTIENTLLTCCSWDIYSEVEWGLCIDVQFPEEAYFPGETSDPYSFNRVVLREPLPPKTLARYLQDVVG